MIEIKCPKCGKELEIIKHTTKCECGARIKLIDYWNGED